MYQRLLMWTPLALVLVAGCEPEDDGGPTVELTAVFAQMTIQEDPWEGIEGCVEGSGTCGTSDGEGRLPLAVPASSDVELTCTGGADFYPHVIGFGTGEDDEEFPINAALRAGFELSFDRVDDLLGTPVDRDLGFLILNARNARGDTDADVAGVTATIEPDDGTPVFYTDELGLVSDDPETSGHGQLSVYGLPTGTYTLTLSHPTRTCSAWIAWPGDTAGQLRVPVRAGHVTQASAACVE